MFLEARASKLHLPLSASGSLLRKPNDGFLSMHILDSRGPGDTDEDDLVDSTISLACRGLTWLKYLPKPSTMWLTLLPRRPRMLIYSILFGCFYFCFIQFCLKCFCFFFWLLKIIIKVQLIYNVVPISAVHQSDIYLLTWGILPCQFQVKRLWSVLSHLCF